MRVDVDGAVTLAVQLLPELRSGRCTSWMNTLRRKALCRQPLAWLA
jgi:hypothetical protein